MSEPLLITVEDAARRLGISRTSAYELVKAGTLPARRLPGLRIVRVRVEDVEKLARGEEIEQRPRLQAVKP